MNGFLQPNPTVLALLSLQTFFYLPILLVLAGCRAGAARSASRWLGGLAAMIAIVGIAAQFGPPFFKLYSGPIPQASSILTKSLGGMALPLGASLPLILSAFATGRRWKWIDVAHLLLLLVLLGLWGWTRVF